MGGSPLRNPGGPLCRRSPAPVASGAAKAETNAPGALTSLKIRPEEIERDNQNLRQKLTDAMEAAVAASATGHRGKGSRSAG